MTPFFISVARHIGGLSHSTGMLQASNGGGLVR